MGGAGSAWQSTTDVDARGRVLAVGYSAGVIDAGGGALRLTATRRQRRLRRLRRQARALNAVDPTGPAPEPRRAEPLRQVPTANLGQRRRAWADPRGTSCGNSTEPGCAALHLPVRRPRDCQSVWEGLK